MSLKIGLIGLGAMGQKHLAAAKTVEEIELVGIVDSAPGRRLVAGETPFFGSLTELIVHAKPDAIVISTPTESHEQLTLEAIGQGLHVLVEKPIAHTVAAAQRMREAAIAAGVCLQVGHIEQFNPAVVDAKRRLADGEIGDLMAIHCRRFCAYPKRITDVGVTLDLGIHDLELAVSLDPSPVRLLHGICASKSEIGLDEHIIATLQFRSGVTATIEESWIAHRHERTVLFVGTRGTIAANLSHPHLSITLGNNAAPETLSTIEVPIARSNALADEWRAFVAAILTGTEKVQVDRAIAAIDIATQLIVS